MLADGIPAGFLMSSHFAEPYQGNYCVKSFAISSLLEKNYLVTPGQIHGNYTNYA